MQSLQWILFNCGDTIEPCLKFYAVPSQSQCMTLRSKSQTLNFFCVKSLQCQLLQSLWLIWIVFGMNGYKILKCFRKEKRVSGELPGDRSYYAIWCKKNAWISRNHAKKWSMNYQQNWSDFEEIMASKVGVPTLKGQILENLSMLKVNI